MMNILAIDTSTSNLSILLKTNNHLISETIENAREENEAILDRIDALLKNMQIQLDEIDYLACGIGPGSFVGVRLGVSVIQGLAFALDKPIVSFSSMQAMAATMLNQHQLTEIQLGLDARMGDVYYGIYQRNHENIIEIIKENAQLIDQLQFDQTKKALSGDIFKYEVITNQINAYEIYHLERLDLKHMLETLEYKIQSGQVLKTPEDLQPVYLQGTKNWKKASS